MPTYEYRCTECRTKFEARVTVAGRDWDVACPHCGSSDIKRLPSAPAFKLIGKGFHAVDYKGKK